MLFSLLVKDAKEIVSLGLIAFLRAVSSTDNSSVDTATLLVGFVAFV